MNVTETLGHKKIVIKWENVITFGYVLITLFKYFITENYHIPTLLFDLTIDGAIGYLIYIIIYSIRKDN